MQLVSATMPQNELKNDVARFTRPTSFKPVNNLICCKICLMWTVKRATSLFKSFCSNVAKQVARSCYPFYHTFKSHLRGVFLGILDGGVPPGSPNPDVISDQKMSFSTPVFRPVL